MRILLATTFVMGCGFGIADAAAKEPKDQNTAPAGVQNAGRYSFGIAARPLAETFDEIGRITGLSIVVKDARRVAIAAQPVQGTLTARQALATALAGTGVRYRFGNSTTVTVELPRASAQDANAQATILETINVEGGSAGKPGGSIGYLATRTSTATKTNMPLRDVPQAVSVVTKEQVQDIGAQRLEDVAHYIPGVNWHQGEGNRDQVIIRGQSSTADFFVNGMRDDGQVFRDLYNTELIEVLKGPNAMIFGRGGGGGVLNRVLKEADGVPVNEWRIQGGSFSDRRISGDVGGKITDTVSGRINGVFEETDSYRDYFHMQRGGINPTLTWAPTPWTKIKLSYEYFHDYRTADRGIPSQAGQPYFPASPSTFFGNPTLSNTSLTQNIATAQIDHDFGNGLTVRSQTRFAAYQHYYQNVYAGSAVSTATNMLTLAAYQNSNDRQNLMNQTDWTYKFQTGSVKHTAVVGTEIGEQKTANARFTGIFGNGTATSNPISASSPTTFQGVTFSGLSTDARNQTKLDLAAAYIQDQIEFTRWLQFIGGVRFDRFDLSYVNLNGQDVNLGQRFSRIDNLVSPRAGFVVKPIDPLSIYVSYSVSFLPASGDQFNALAVGTASAAPEKFVNKEIGAKWDVTSRLAFTTALYNLDRTNSRFPDPNNPGFFILSGATQTRGVETSLAGYVTDQWQMTAGYAYTDARVVGATSATITPGNRVALVPYNTFSIWNRYDFTSMWGAGLGVIHASNSFAGSDDTVLLPSYTRVDGAIFWKLDRNLRAQINVENIFGAKYYPNADSNNNITIGPPQAIRFALTTNFAGTDRPWAPVLNPFAPRRM